MAKRNRNRKENREANKKKSIIEMINSYKEIITFFVGFIAVLYPIINTVYKIFYQRECEKFYGLPGKYFSSSFNNRIIYLGCIFLLVMIAIMPLSIKKYGDKRGITSKGNLLQAIFLSIVIGMELGVFNVFNLIEIMKQTYKSNNFFRIINGWLNRNAVLTILIVVIFGLMSVLGITLLDKIRDIRWKLVKNMVCYLLSVSFVVSMLIMLYGTIFKLSITINDKTKYEFVTINNNEYVVISSYDNKLLVVPFEIYEDEIYIFKTKQYCFEEPYEGIYEYRNIENSPIIDFDK
ncbi:MAG: hypothetical protein HFI34_12430 [Lachnospiraceae bacterium]|nr:hypothetical protein [Lachnospiraceae bacterium]